MIGEGSQDGINGKDRTVEQELVLAALRIKLADEIFHHTIGYGCAGLTTDKSSRFHVLIVAWI